MKKYLIVFLMLSCLSVQAQTVHRVNEIKSVAMGGLRLIEDAGGYCMLVRTGNRYEPNVVVDLGDSANAVRLLTFMVELKMRSDDIVELENPTDNFIYKGGFGGFRIYERTRTIDGYAHPSNIKKLLKALVEGGRERKPAYRRYDDED